MKPAGSLLLGACLLACLPALKPGPVEQPRAPWVEVRTAHFVVASNASEAEARGVAVDFEQIRALFHTTFPELRVDPAQPIVILAARDEATMRTIAPEEWGGEEHIRPSGLFHSDGEKDYVVLRLDAQGTTAYHTVYHEYTHALLHLNFSQIPLWLSEGVAEFFGNSTVGPQEARTGTADKTHLYILSKNEWLPMETLLKVRGDSPYYNEKNPASIFYAQSWAATHYLLLDPEARREQLLQKFLLNWNGYGDRVRAGSEAFGDLGRFGETVKRYVRQANWRAGVALPGQANSGGDASVRTLAAAEVLALRGDFFVHRKQMEAARPLLEQGVELGPEIAATHEALGFYDFRNGDFAAADEEMGKASFVNQVHQYFAQGISDRASTAVSSAISSSTTEYKGVFKANDLIGMKVKNSSDADLGKVDNVAVDLPNGHIPYVILSPDSSLKLGNDYFALPPNSVMAATDRKYLTTDLTKEKLAGAPHFAKNDWANLSNRTWASQVYQYYGKRAYFDMGSRMQPTGRTEDKTLPKTKD